MRRRSLLCSGPGHAFHPRLRRKTELVDRVQFVQNLLSAALFAANFSCDCIEQAASDRDFAWKFRQLQYIEPVCRLYFFRLRSQLAARPLADERDHQRMRERPRLAGEVADVVYSHADFLADLARHALLERFAWLHEAGK